MPPRKRVPVEANPDLEDESLESEEDEGSSVAVAEKPKYRTLKYLGNDANWNCFATSPPLEFKNRVCREVPETVATVLIKNKKKNGLPLFKDITPGVEKLSNPETDGLPEEDDEGLFED